MLWPSFEARVRGRKRGFFAKGTEGSNPSPSSGESVIPWKRAQRFRWVEVRRLRFADLLGAHPLGFLTSEFIRTYQLHRSLKRQSRQAIGLLLKLSAANFEGCASAISMGWHHTYGHAFRPFAGGIWGESKAEALCFRWL